MQSIMDKTYCTLGEANGMVPELQEAFPRLIQLQNQVRILHRRLNERGVDVGEDFRDPEEELDDASLIDLATLNALIGALRDDLERFASRGALIKSIDSGLVDWYARREEQDIFLCWKMGEQEVEWWHSVDGGYGARRPVSEL